MKAYIDYKAWWIETQAPHKVPSLYWGDSSEQAFTVHVSELSLYSLMELLVEWHQEVPNLEAVASLENEVEAIKDTVGSLDRSNDWRR
jgi:hypothetical protein